jgi:hypothetical protein
MGTLLLATRAQVIVVAHHALETVTNDRALVTTIAGNAYVTNIRDFVLDKRVVCWVVSFGFAQTAQIEVITD